MVLFHHYIILVWLTFRLSLSLFHYFFILLLKSPKHLITITIMVAVTYNITCTQPHHDGISVRDLHHHHNLYHHSIQQRQWQRWKWWRWWRQQHHWNCRRHLVMVMIASSTVTYHLYSTRAMLTCKTLFLSFSYFITIYMYLYMTINEEKL